MYNPRLKEKAILLLCLAVVLFGIATTAYAFVRPLNPTMDYVPQNIGIYDTYYENFNEPDCRTCHELSLERHHTTEYALNNNCLYCHRVRPDIVPPERDCTVCHVDGGPIGDFGNPHHKSDLADSGQCDQCHLHVAETYSVETLYDEPTDTTPAPSACGNCHWPSGSVPHEPATYDGDTAKFLADWQNWTGDPKPTTWLNYRIILSPYDLFPRNPCMIEDPQPIEAYGPVASIVDIISKPYRPFSGTHHEISGKVFPKCYYCHASGPNSYPDWNPDNPYLFRFCENCHTKKTLHSIQEHVATNNIYTINGDRNQTVTDNEKCVGCHGDYIQEIDLPSYPVVKPVIDHIEPNFGPPGIIVGIIPAVACDNDGNPLTPDELCSFGLKEVGDAVEMGQLSPSTGTWYWVNVPIHSWSEHLIRIRVPAWQFSPGKTRIRVHKENIGTTRSEVFILREYPVVQSLTPPVGSWSQLVKIGGKGFSVVQEKVSPNGYGYSTYVELSASARTYRVTRYLGPRFWDPNMIYIWLRDLIDVNDGTLVPDDALYEGCWNVTVTTDYFKDDGDGKYNYGLDGLDTPTTPLGTGTGDILIYRATTNPICFASTREPYINKISPNPTPYWDTAAIYGSNFGPTQGTSVVKVWDLKKTRFRSVEVRSWSNTKITFKAPGLGTDPTKYPKNIYMQVVVDGRPGSNYYLLSIMAR